MAGISKMHFSSSFPEMVHKKVALKKIRQKIQRRTLVMESLFSKIASKKVCSNAVEASSELLASIKLEFTFGRMS